MSVRIQCSGQVKLMPGTWRSRGLESGLEKTCKEKVNVEKESLRLILQWAIDISFKKWAIPGLFFVYFRLFITVQILKI